MRAWLFVLLILGPVIGYCDITPFVSDKFLLAGSSDLGLRDGRFYEAAFNGPMGMALSEDRSALYVADSGNRCVRVVDLSDQNKVSTALRLPEKGVEGIESLAVLKKTVFFTSKNKKGLWRAPLAGGTPILIGGAAEVAGSVSAPLAVPSAGRVFWIDIPGKCLAYADIEGNSKAISANITSADLASGTRLLLMDNNIYLSEGSGRLGRIDIVGGGPTSSAAPLSGAVSSIDWIPGKTLGFTNIAAMDGRAAFIGWDGVANGLRFLALTGETYQLPLRNTLGEPLSNFLTGTAAVAPYQWMSGQGTAIYDDHRGRVYFSDPWRQNILGWTWRNPAGSNEDRGINTAPLNKDPKTERVFFVTPSYGVLISGPGGAIQKTVWRQFELNMNYLSALHGTDTQYEIPMSGGGLDVTRGIITYVLNNLKYYKSRKANWVAAFVDHQSLLLDLCNLPNNPQADDIVLSVVDPEFATSTRGEREAKYGPLTKELVSIVAKNKEKFKDLLELQDDGKLFLKYNDASVLLGEPRLLDLLTRYEDKILTKIKAAADAEGLKVAFVYGPNFIGRNRQGIDIRSLPDGSDPARSFVLAARSKGMLAVNLIPAVRVIGPTLGPMSTPSDAHFLPDIHPWIGRMAAEALFSEMQAPR